MTTKSQQAEMRLDCKRKIVHLFLRFSPSPRLTSYSTLPHRVDLIYSGDSSRDDVFLHFLSLFSCTFDFSPSFTRWINLGAHLLLRWTISHQAMARSSRLRYSQSLFTRFTSLASTRSIDPLQTHSNQYTRFDAGDSFERIKEVDRRVQDRVLGLGESVWDRHLLVVGSSWKQG